MASTYPGALDTLATAKANATTTFTDHPNHHNDMADAINKIEAELGTNPRGASATVAARIGLLETNGSAHEYAYVERTTSLNSSQTVNASADVYLTAAATAFDGATKVRVEAYIPEMFNTVVTNYNNVILFEDGTIRTILIRRFSPSTTQGNSGFGVFEFTPTAATHTYSLRISVSAGTGTFNAGTGTAGGFPPAYLRVIKV